MNLLVRITKKGANMNWKKLLANIGIAAVVGGLTPIAQGAASGHQVPITVGTTLVPIVLVIGKSLAALFQTPPNAPSEVNK